MSSNMVSKDSAVVQSRKRARPEMVYGERVGVSRYSRATQRVPRYLKKMIDDRIQRAEEVKQGMNYSLNSPLPSSANTNWALAAIPLGPNTLGVGIPQGTGQGQRVGNRITTRKCIFRGIIHANPYDATTNPAMIPVQIRMVVYRDKTLPTAQPPDARTDLFQQGSVTLGLQNDLADMILPFNEDKYRVVATKVMKLGYAAFDTTGTQVGNGGWHNNDFKANCEFELDVTKFLPKTVIYNDNSNTPTTPGLWCNFICSYANGGLIGSTTVAATLQWTLTYDYSDA